jgi:hypothetical protein
MLMAAAFAISLTAAGEDTNRADTLVLELAPGPNYVSFRGCSPHTRSVRQLPRNLPAGEKPSQATRVRWSSEPPGIEPDGEIWLQAGPANRWVWSLGGEGPAEEAVLPAAWATAA